jgi:hypothetical protein
VEHWKAEQSEIVFPVFSLETLSIASFLDWKTDKLEKQLYPIGLPRTLVETP